MKETAKPLSIIVPTLNEADNLQLLFQRISATLDSVQIPYEIIIIDDHSKDATLEIAKNFAKKYPVKVFLKEGKRGKAFSLLEGFDHASYELVCMIDADLQYPPEAIVPMYIQLAINGADMVITERKEQGTSILRQLSTKVFHLVFTRMLFGIKYDTQSGLKLFKKHMIEGMALTPSPWSFDLELIVRALEREKKIISYEIPFSERFAGQAKVHVVKTAIELAKASIKLRGTTSMKRVRVHYKQNLEFNRGLMLSLITLATAGLLMIGINKQASAYSVHAIVPPHVTMQITNNLTTKQVSVASTTANTLASSSTANNVQTPHTQSGQNASSEQTVSKITNPGSNQTSQNMTTSANQANTPTQAVPAANIISVPISSNQAVVSSQPSTVLNATPTSFYQKSNNLSDSTKNFLILTATRLLLIGVVIVVIACLLIVTRLLFRPNYNMSHSK